MGAGASTVATAKGADAATIAAGVQALSSKDRAILKAAMQASKAGDGKTMADSVKGIAENEAQIHELNLAVMTASKESSRHAR